MKDNIFKKDEVKRILKDIFNDEDPEDLVNKVTIA